MIEQRSEAWREQRKNMVTGSRAGAILGLSPFSKPEDVMRSMVRDYHGAESEFTGNIATEYGNENEDAAIFALEQLMGFEVIETGFHKAESWLGASPDGLVGNDAVVEVKCPFGKRNITSPDEFKSLDEQPSYYAQMQIEMLATNTDKCHFFQWAEGASRYELVEANQEWLDKNIPVLADFHDSYLEIIADKELSAPYLEDETLDMSLDDKWLAAEDVFLAAKIEMEVAKTLMDTAKAKLVELANGRKCASSLITVFKVEKKGSIKYSQIIKDKSIAFDTEKYQGKSSTSWNVRTK